MFLDVMVIILDFLGLGKIESICILFVLFEKGMKSFYISGLNNKFLLIQWFKEFDLKLYEIFYIEIGFIDRLEELDIFLFEFVILRYVLFFFLLYVLLKIFIVIEIENFLN